METTLQPTAYMKWLVRECPDRESLAEQLFADCKEQNPQAFEIVDAIGNKQYSPETFYKAADLVLELVKQ